MSEFQVNADAGMQADISGSLPAGKKLRYGRPTLSVYGSVRQLTGNNSGVNAGDALGMMLSASDLACKENAVRIGDHAAGFGIYLFDYKPEFRNAFGHGRQFGVIAQEVERIVPAAVAIGEDGLRRVDYAKLGITRH